MWGNLHVCTSLTNTNNQHVSWDNLSTFKHNLLHLGKKDSEHKSTIINIYFVHFEHLTNWHNGDFPTLPCHPRYLWPLSHYRSCKISRSFLTASAGTTEFHPKPAKQWEHRIHDCFLPSWWVCQFQDPECSGRASRCCRSRWDWRPYLTNRMQFPCLKNIICRDDSNGNWPKM